ncbi:GNAT family N-acetyltransferase [Geosporobacter ferrireducens]|uniref:GNAT family N-acetyltransferase n=1 Tax=Geosporobacter ferrireducens TaxID=1424294 RepID=UPI00139BB554|nr:GNAT family N-acetyltransferase [Geosporobacter ferrireducens]MTI57753.1 GNAT family N-acetyltransferase [Geosporobacter ferrireducens]
MNMIIRKADISDIKDICMITREAFKKYALDLGLPQKVSALKETEETIKNEFANKNILIACSINEAIGCIRYEIMPGNIAYISRFAVKPTIQNSGIGKALFLAVEDALIKDNMKAVALHTASKMTALMRFYYSLGFHIHSTASDRGYTRALLCKEFIQGEPPDLSHVQNI